MLTPFGEATGQEAAEAEQLLVDAEALMVATEVTTRCALYDSRIAYLTPLEQVGAKLRLEEMLMALATAIENVPDRTAEMRQEVAAIPCGDDELETYMDFGRQIGRDMVDIALVAWRTIDIERCNYFADDDFVRAARRARAVAAEATIEGAENRQSYIERRAATWVSLFADNCANLAFDPVRTLPGQIALMLPTE